MNVLDDQNNEEVTPKREKRDTALKRLLYHTTLPVLIEFLNGGYYIKGKTRQLIFYLVLNLLQILS
jgi:hypothetical protein